MVVRNTEKKGRQRKGLQSISKSRWLSYAAAGAATVVAGQQTAENADAFVVHVDPEPDIVVSAGTAQSVFVPYSLDMNGDSLVDVTPQHAFVDANGVAALMGSSNSFAGFSAGGYFYPARLASGVSVATAGMITNNRGDMAWLTGYSNSQWLGSTTGASSTGYIGVRFAAADGTHYGWVRATVGPYAQNIITLHEWAYEDAVDAPILTGQTTGGVPEPGSLGLLALGGVGLLAWRKRRKQAAA